MQRRVDLAALGAGRQRDPADDIPDRLGRRGALLRVPQRLGEAFHLGPVEAGKGGQGIGLFLRCALQPPLEIRLFALQGLQARHQGAAVAARLHHGDDLRNALVHLDQRPAVCAGHGAAFAFQAVGLLDVGAHGRGCDLRGHQPVAQAGQDALLQDAARDGAAVGAAAVHHMVGAAVAVLAAQDIASATAPAEDEPGEQGARPVGPVQALGMAGLDGGGVGDREHGLPLLDRLPERIVDNAQFGHLLDDPLLWRIEPRDPFAARGVFHVAQAVPDQPADVEFVVDEAGAAPGVAAQGGVDPELAGRAGNALGVEVLRDGARADTRCEVPEDPAHDLGLGRVDAARTAQWLAVRVGLLNDIVAVAEPTARLSLLDPAAQAAMGLGGEVLEEERVHGALEAHVQFADRTLGQGDDLHAGKPQVLEERRHIGLIAAHAVQGLSQHHIEAPG